MIRNLKIKVCGMKFTQNREVVETLDIDMLGYIFYGPSKRFVGVQPDRGLFNSNKPKVAVFVNANAFEILGLVKNLGFEIKLSEEAKDYVLDKGYDIQYGARPLKRAIQKYLEDPMAETIIKSALVEGDIMLVDFDKDAEEITVAIQKKTGVLPKAKKELADGKKKTSNDKKELPEGKSE